jgi:hypothetical protein
MQDLIRNSKNKNKAWLDKQVINGRQGGAPKGNQNAQKQPTVEKTTQNNPKQPNAEKTTQTSHNGNGNGNVNDNVNVNYNENVKNNDNEKKGFPEAQTDQGAQEPVFLGTPVLHASPEEAEPTAPAPSTRPAIHPAPVEGQPPVFAARASPLPTGDFVAWHEAMRKEWNSLFPDMPARTIATNLNDFVRKDLVCVWKAAPDSLRNNKAMANYAKIRGQPNTYNMAGCVYKSFEGFVKNGLDKYSDDVQPFKRFLSPEGRQALALKQSEQGEREASIARMRAAQSAKEAVA